MSAARVDQIVERDLDGLTFRAVVIAVHVDEDDGEITLDIRYTDDGNVEREVPVDEVTVLDGAVDEGKSSSSAAGEDAGRGAGAEVAGRRGQQEGKEGARGRGKRSVRGGAEEGKAAPMSEDAGALPADSQPQVLIHDMHQDSGAATAFVINGSGSDAAAGSGLRGIRWLKDNEAVT